MSLKMLFLTFSIKILMKSLEFGLYVTLLVSTSD